MKISSLIIFFLMIASNAFDQQEQEKIKWQEDRPLTWNDFKAEPDTSLSYSANTNSGISYNWDYSTATGKPVLNHEVFTNFYPNRSWVQDDINDEEYLLGHEQLHFDISELHARKLRQALDNYEPGRTIRLDLKRIYNRIEEERTEMQNRFDRETSHSENEKAEQEWREFVGGELKKLEEYSS